MGTSASVMTRTLVEGQYVDILVRPTFEHLFDKYGSFGLYGKLVTKGSDETGLNYVLDRRVKIGQLVLRDRAANTLIDRLHDRGPTIFDKAVDLNNLTRTADLYTGLYAFSEKIYNPNLKRTYESVPEGSNYFTKFETGYDKVAGRHYILLTMDNDKVIRLELWSNKSTRYFLRGSNNNTYARNYISVNQSTIFIMLFVNQYGPANDYTSKLLSPFFPTQADQSAGSRSKSQTYIGSPGSPSSRSRRRQRRSPGRDKAKRRSPSKK